MPLRGNRAVIVYSVVNIKPVYELRWGLLVDFRDLHLGLDAMS